MSLTAGYTTVTLRMLLLIYNQSIVMNQWKRNIHIQYIF